MNIHRYNYLNILLCILKSCLILSIFNGCSFQSESNLKNSSSENSLFSFKTKAYLEKYGNTSKSKLIFTVQNASEKDVYVLNDITHVIVNTTSTSDSSLNSRILNFGYNSDAEFVKLSKGEITSVSVLLRNSVEEEIRLSMNVKAPLKYKLASDADVMSDVFSFDVF